MAAVWTRLMISLLCLGLISGTLIGNYKLYDSMGDYLYDFSSNSNYAKLVTNSCSGDYPKVTDRGTILGSCNAIELPTKSLNEMAVAYWINVATEDPGRIFSVVSSSNKYKVRYKSEDTGIELKLSKGSDGKEFKYLELRYGN